MSHCKQKYKNPSDHIVIQSIGVKPESSEIVFLLFYMGYRLWIQKNGGGGFSKYKL